MVQSVLGNLFIAAVIALLPLVGAPERLLHPGPWLGFVAAAVILITQPPIGLKTMVTDAGDRLSALGIFAGNIGALVVALVQFGYRDVLRPAPLSGLVIAGALITASGLLLRITAIRTLGRFFTSTVVVQEGQTVVDTGPYRLLRHPSYTGAIVTCLGVTLALASIIGVLLVLGLSAPAYLYRIRVEERALVEGLGDAYTTYQKRTWRLMPFLF